MRLLGQPLRPRLAHGGIVVSVICPGYVETPTNAAGRPRIPLAMSAERAATIIERGLARGQARIAFPLATYFAMRLLTNLPPNLAARLTVRPLDKP